MINAINQNNLVSRNGYSPSKLSQYRLALQIRRKTYPFNQSLNHTYTVFTGILIYTTPKSTFKGEGKINNFGVNSKV